jgi:sodium transport system permease protein
MPVYLPCSFLGVAPVLPGIELDRVTAWVPVVNITLLIKASLVGRASAELAFFALASSALYAALALLVAARVFANDEVLLGGDGRSAVTGWARSIRSEVGPGAGIFAFAAAMTLVFYVSGALAPLSLPLKIAVVQLGCFLAPALLCAAVFGGWRRSTFGLHAPSSRVLSGAVVLGLSVWSLASLAVWLVPPPADLIQELAATLSLPGVPLPVVWLVLAVLPAVCEEFFFRGLLMGAFARLGPTAALVSTSLLFGLAHGSVYRMLPTTMLGAVLAFVRLRSGSVLPGMVLHGVHNALLVTVIRLRPELAEATGAPAWAYAVAAVGLLSGGALVLRAGGARPPTTA